MSRCFPFPPHGYEKKPRTDDHDADLLRKEKHREKKHKKEKKDKEQRERKEKREKDRSDGKYREKKHRKDKHRDKRKEKEKEKERDKDKNKSNTTEEKSSTDQSEICNGEKFNQREGEGERDNVKSSLSNEKKQVRNGEKHNQNILSEGAGDSKFLQELARRFRHEEKGTASQLVERFPVAVQKNDVRVDKVVVMDIGILSEGKQNNKRKRLDDRKINGKGNRGDTRSSGSAVVQNFVGMVQNRVEGMPRPLVENIEGRMEEGEKRKEMEGDKKQGDNQKDKDWKKKSHGKDKDREKEKEKKEKGSEKSKHKSEGQDKFKDRNKNGLVGAQNIKTSQVSEDRNTASDGNFKKRKNFETNGFLHETDIRPSKMPRPSLHPSTENGRKLVPCRTPVQSTSDWLGPPNNLKVDNKEHKVNGVIEAQSLSISSKKSSAITQADQIAQASPNNLKMDNKEHKVNGVIEAKSLSISSKNSSAISQADHIAQASMKPPHPDCKYLSQVLSVPKMEEWSDFDDQEWLFSSESRLSENPDVGSVGFTQMPRVWAKALQIESADVWALPYVIPY